MFSFAIPDGVWAAATAQGEVDAGEKGELAAVVVGFEGGEGAFLTGVFVFDTEDAVVGANTRNQEKKTQKEPYF